jgi:hypothetical protein
MYEDVYNELIRPLIVPHWARGGTSLSEEDCEAVCLMLLAKII